MTEHFCNYENSLMLKELGFDEESIAIHIGGSVFMGVYGRKNSIQDDNYPIAPLLSQVIQWIYLEENYIIIINWDSDLLGWRYQILDNVLGRIKSSNQAYETWNQCAQDAITTTLKIIKEDV